MPAGQAAFNRGNDLGPFEFVDWNRALASVYAPF
jgi:hypothetical protein